ncbi:MAG: molybdopterin-dependent oxidoreductase [Desulfobacteraceae bacterium]|nr:molybdopterin-dependent oxidoreductase [Desulfobacteraceae bacterium]
MKKQVMVSCSMDCFDLCRFLVVVDDNRVVSLQGDPNHPVTRGFVCKKGKNLLDCLVHKDRLLYPLIKKNNQFVKASYEEVFDKIIEKLTLIKKKYGNTAILNYTSGGYGGLKARIQSIFFNSLGGDTRFEGSLCWGAGIAAQGYDFGQSRGHEPGDILNSKLVILWGRNPKHTSIHLQSLLVQARKQGTKVIVIDPVQTATARAFDEHISIVPSTDGVLALAMTNVLIQKNLVDGEFVRKYVLGFKRFKRYLSEFTTDVASDITGIAADKIETLAIEYATTDPSAIYIGYGMQRYENGGNNIRCIDALAALAGHIGKKGAGVNYASKSLAPFLNFPEKKSQQFATQTRTFPAPKLGAFLEGVSNPPIKAAFVSSGNPLVQSPDLFTTVREFSKIDFKVVFDHFMTDTASHADIVLPAAFVFEQEDIFASSMYSPVLNYSQKAVDPPDTILPEFEFFLELSRRIGIDHLGFDSSAQYLDQCVAPLLAETCVCRELTGLESEYIQIKAHKIAWEEKQFLTPSGKIEIYSEKALADGLSALPRFIPPQAPSPQFPLRLLTCHAKDTMHSQGFMDENKIPIVYINGKTARQFAVFQGERVDVCGKKAYLGAMVCVDESICDSTAFMYQGYWHKSGAVNFLTDSRVSDMGGQAAYYDSFCTLKPLKPV